MIVHEIETEDFDEEWNEELILMGYHQMNEAHQSGDRVAGQIRRRESQGSVKAKSQGRIYLRAV